MLNIFVLENIDKYTDVKHMILSKEVDIYKIYNDENVELEIRDVVISKQKFRLMYRKNRTENINPTCKIYYNLQEEKTEIIYGFLFITKLDENDAIAGLDYADVDLFNTLLSCSEYEIVDEVIHEIKYLTIQQDIKKLDYEEIKSPC